MRPRGSALRRAASLALASALGVACFYDAGLQLDTGVTDAATSTTASTSAPTTSSSTTSSSSSGSGSDGTTADSDSTTAAPVVCGDGGLHIGQLGPPVAIPGGGGSLFASDDAPRTLGVDEAGNFVVIWRAKTADRAHIRAQRLGPDGALDGASLELLKEFYADIGDPVLAVSASGDYAIAWPIPGELQNLLFRGVQGNQPNSHYKFDPSNTGHRGPSLAITPNGSLAVAALHRLDDDTEVVELYRFSNFLFGSNAAVRLLSDHDTGYPTPPSVAVHPDSTIVVAWGHPNGDILYRRLFPPALELGPIVDTGLKVGGGAPASGAPWAPVAIRPTDSAVAVAGLAGDRLTLRLFDASDAKIATAPVAELDAAFVPFVDLASDPWGHLAVAWVACGEPDAADTDCTTLPSSAALRWFYSDLTPFAPPTVISAQASGAPAPVSLAVAPSGVTAISYHSGEDIVVRVAPLTCSP